MDDETKARLVELADRPIASLTFRELALVMGCLDAFEDEVVALIPEFAGLRDV